MKIVSVVMAAILACLAGIVAQPLRAQEKMVSDADRASLEKELFALEIRWLKAEFDKKMTGPDSMGELWTDQFFDVLNDGRVVNKPQMMDIEAKTERKPGTGAFPRDFKIRSIYANGTVALATDHTTIKGVDASGNIVPVREFNVMRVFIKENGKWRVGGATLVPAPAEK
jgi:hypothetical protein